MSRVHNSTAASGRDPADYPAPKQGLPQALPPGGIGLSPSQLGRVELAVESSPAPTQIGPYRLEEPIGTGGMGVVYRAEQDEPIRRTVALKLIKPGMDSREIINRFQSERQALAMMNHRNVAKVLDAGTSDDGRPYFVMEYVPGKSITQYCDEHRYTIKQRLTLFIQACEAVQHAHQKAIIHRDIKPSNILVTGESGDAEVKVIDFGVAKALSPDAEESHTLHTRVDQLLGTPDYMSPEQASSDGHGVDTRSDIYSLGVVLYEFLTGALPFDPKTLRSSGVAEIQRIIREVDPPRPSTRLSTLGEGASEIASNRATRADTLSRELRGELEWIPLKAMRKEPDRRYTSAHQLAEDIRNYLKNKPLLACPESLIYRTKKFLHRHRAGVAASIAMVLILAAVTGLYIHSIRTEQARTLAALLDAENARDTAQAVTDFLTQDLFGGATPLHLHEQHLRDSIVAAMIDPVAARIPERFSDRPLTEASIRNSLAQTYSALGRADLGFPHALRALELNRSLLGETHPATLKSMHVVGLMFWSQERYGDAERYWSHVLSERQRVIDHAHPDLTTSLNDLGLVYMKLGRLTDAESLLRAALERNRDSVNMMNNLGEVLWEQGRRLDAASLWKEALERAERNFDRDHPIAIRSLNNHARMLQAQGRHREAETVLHDVLERSKRLYGTDHPVTVRSLSMLKSVQEMGGRDSNAE